MDSGAPSAPPQEYAAAGRIPLAVVVVDGDGLVSHWSTGARHLFGPAREVAIGRPAVELLPVFGALASDAADDFVDGYGRRALDDALGGLTDYPAAGRARLSDPAGTGSTCSGGPTPWSGPAGNGWSSSRPTPASWPARTRASSAPRHRR